MNEVIKIKFKPNPEDRFSHNEALIEVAASVGMTVHVYGLASLSDKNQPVQPQQMDSGLV